LPAPNGLASPTITKNARPFLDKLLLILLGLGDDKLGYIRRRLTEML
jgi:hypothetical protein